MAREANVLDEQCNARPLSALVAERIAGMHAWPKSRTAPKD
jgi:hypothetical protein